MRKIKLIIFDLDGTLVDAYLAIAHSFNYVMQKFGYPRQDVSTIRRAVGRGDKNLLKGFVSDGDLDKALSAYRQNHKKSLLKWARLMPGAHSILKYLKSKEYKLAVASNRPTRFSLFLIRHLKISGYFDYVLCADKLKKLKPHPKILNKIMARLGVSAEETVFVGDMGIDAETARRAKVKAVIVTTGSGCASGINKEKPFRIITKISALRRIF